MDTSTAFPQIETMTPAELELARADICRSANGNYDNLELDALKLLSAITAALRRKTAGPPKAASAKKKAAKTPKMTLDDAFGGL